MKALIVVGTLLSGVMLPNPCDACSCAPPPPDREAAGEAAAVFTGRVTTVKAGASHAESVVTLVVERAFDGAKVKQRIDLFQESMCGFEFKTTVRYLVYAGLDDKDRLNASICSRTKRIQGAAKEIAKLGKLPKEAFSIDLRDIRPLDARDPQCLEMVSACSDDPEPVCTSAPFYLPCGSVGRVPGGDRVRCVCD